LHFQSRRKVALHARQVEPLMRRTMELRHETGTPGSPKIAGVDDIFDNGSENEDSDEGVEISRVPRLGAANKGAVKNGGPNAALARVRFHHGRLLLLC